MICSANIPAGKSLPWLALHERLLTVTAFHLHLLNIYGYTVDLVRLVMVKHFQVLLLIYIKYGFGGSIAVQACHR